MKSAGLRSNSNDALGLVPAPGWDGRYDWQGFIPPEGTASVTDPPSGEIATANNKTVPEGYKYTLTREWDAGYRYDRIQQLLAQVQSNTPARFAAMQNDIIDPYAIELKRRLAAAAPFPAADQKAANLVFAWNGAMAANRPEPLIFTESLLIRKRNISELLDPARKRPVAIKLGALGYICGLTAPTFGLDLRQILGRETFGGGDFGTQVHCSPPALIVSRALTTIVYAAADPISRDAGPVSARSR